MFFTDDRTEFFRPLTGKHREQVVECLRLLHETLYSTKADYGESLKRDQVLDVFIEALERAPLLEGDDEVGRFQSNREQATWVLNTLVEHDWLAAHTTSLSGQRTRSITKKSVEDLMEWTECVFS